MPGEVFAISLRTHFREDLSHKMLRLFQALRPEKLVEGGSLWAIKLHFGEAGGHTFIRPHLIRIFVEALKLYKARPFLTDTNTLYAGQRTNSVDHLELALRHGFGHEVTGAPLIIADGIKGGAEVAVEVNRGELPCAWLGSELAAADGILVLSHFKGHKLTGFGGALKNLGMGSASRRGKLRQHSDLKPRVLAKKCVACGRCLRFCAHGALSARDNPGIDIQPKPGRRQEITGRPRRSMTSTEPGKVFIDQSKCVGCAACIAVCPEGAIAIPWEGDAEKFMKKMVEYAKAALHNKGRQAFFINFLTNISPSCDCLNHSDAPIVADLGILASCDPVALDMASAELINRAPGLPNSALPEAGLLPGADKWQALHPGCPWSYQLEYAEKIGLGSRDYRLTWLAEVKGV